MSKRNLQKSSFWLMAVLAVATAAIAQQTSIQLPPDNPMAKLKSGAGDNVAGINCGLCHSTDYIVRQPHLDGAHWEAEVKKMITVYGAPINAANAKVIADYLAKNYGPEVTVSAPKPPDSAQRR